MLILFLGSLSLSLSLSFSLSLLYTARYLWVQFLWSLKKTISVLKGFCRVTLVHLSRDVLTFQDDSFISLQLIRFCYTIASAVIRLSEVWRCTGNDLALHRIMGLNGGLKVAKPFGLSPCGLAFKRFRMRLPRCELRLLFQPTNPQSCAPQGRYQPLSELWEGRLNKS